MSLFNIKTAQENAIKRVIVKKVQEPIFDKYVRTTLEKIEQSISDANGRYNEGKAYAKAKPSQNWKVVNKTESLEQEEVRVWLKIGVKKQRMVIVLLFYRKELQPLSKLPVGRSERIDFGWAWGVERSY